MPSVQENHSLQRETIIYTGKLLFTYYRNVCLLCKKPFIIIIYTGRLLFTQGNYFLHAAETIVSCVRKPFFTQGNYYQHMEIIIYMLQKRVPLGSASVYGNYCSHKEIIILHTEMCTFRICFCISCTRGERASNSPKYIRIH